MSLVETLIGFLTRPGDTLSLQRRFVHHEKPRERMRGPPYLVRKSDSFYECRTIRLDIRKTIDRWVILIASRPYEFET
jgi:hypothetical protein